MLPRGAHAFEMLVDLSACTCQVSESAEAPYPLRVATSNSAAQSAQQRHEEEAASDADSEDEALTRVGPPSSRTCGFQRSCRLPAI
jgi:hypothetical protein